MIIVQDKFCEQNIKKIDKVKALVKTRGTKEIHLFYDGTEITGEPIVSVITFDKNHRFIKQTYFLIGELV